MVDFESTITFLILSIHPLALSVSPLHLSAIATMQALNSRRAAIGVSSRTTRLRTPLVARAPRQSHVVRVMEIVGEAQWEAEVLKVCILFQHACLVSSGSRSMSLVMHVAGSASSYCFVTLHGIAGFAII